MPTKDSLLRGPLERGGDIMIDKTKWGVTYGHFLTPSGEYELIAKFVTKKEAEEYRKTHDRFLLIIKITPKANQALLNNAVAGAR